MQKPDKHHIDHIDNDSCNNNIDSLRYVTVTQNLKYAFQHHNKKRIGDGSGYGTNSLLDPQSIAVPKAEWRSLDTFFEDKFEKLLINDDGVIMYNDVILSQYKTYKGGYASVYTPTGSINFKTYKVHWLTCYVYNGPPEDKNFVVNYKNEN
ncbi:unnamed protein product [Cunninghamella echinulata]